MKEFSDEFEFNEGYSINYQAVANTSDFLAVTRLLATRLMNNPYMRIGDFFTQLSDGDLEALKERFDEDDDKSNSELLVLTEMLARAEGSESDDLEKISKNMSCFKILLAGTILARNNVLKANFNKFSFGEDMEEEIIFEKLKPV